MYIQSNEIPTKEEIIKSKRVTVNVTESNKTIQKADIYILPFIV